MTVLWRYCVQHLSRIHLDLVDIVDYFWDAVLVSISGRAGCALAQAAYPGKRWRLLPVRPFTEEIYNLNFFLF